ncbi:MAG: type VII secretion target [Actinomycetota bacterium]
MPHLELGVTPAHLRELAIVQQRAAGELVGAAGMVTDDAARVLVSHGVVSAATAEALQTVQRARAGVAAAIAARAGSLGENLVGSAGRYEITDQLSSTRLHL